MCVCVCVCVCLIKQDRHFALASFISDPFKSLYELFDTWME